MDIENDISSEFWELQNLPNKLIVYRRFIFNV